MTSDDELTKIPHQILQGASAAGIELGDENRSATFLHVDQSTIFSKVGELFKGKLELMDTKNALQKYPWLNDYMWKLVDRNKDEFTRKVAQDYSGGYFMRILPGEEIVFPLQSCLMITKEKFEQKVHNIIVVEEGARAHIITSCIQHFNVAKAAHLGITEIYVKKDASFNFTMVHSWSEETMVRPRTGVLIEDKGTFVSNYICVRPVKDVQMYPVAYCNGEDSRASFNSILYGNKNSSLDVGSKAVLNGKGSRAEMISRAIGRENAKVIVRAMMEGNNPDCKGHLECRGLIIDENSLVQSIPELIARKRGVEITHEAAVGKISEKEIEYLMTRKVPRDQAISMIIRGFMDVSIMGLPKALGDEVNRIVDLVAESG
jgi:Fe-S cluster assembly scaffold protein SufB